MKRTTLLVIALMFWAWSVSAQTLVAHYPLDGTALDSSGQSQHGALQGSATWGSGRIDGAVILSGGYIALPSLNVSGSGITLTAWIRPTQAATSSLQPRIVSKATGTAEQDHWWMLSFIDVSGQNRLRLRIKAGGTTSTLIAASSGSVPLNTWSHVAATYDGSAMRLYLNGSLVGSAAKTGTLATSSVAVNIGRNPDGSMSYRGSIDDVRIYAGALSVSAITVLAQAGEPDPDPDPEPDPDPPPPDPNTVTAGEPFQISADHSGVNTDGYRCYLGGTQVGADLPDTLVNGLVICSYPGLAAGEHVLEVAAFNAAGENRSAPFTVTAIGELPPTRPPPGSPRIMRIVR